MSNNNSVVEVPYVGPTGRRSMLKVNLKGTVEELKRVIQDKEGIPPDQYKLMAAGKVMNSSRPVSEYIMYKETCTRGYPTLSVVLPLRGGKRRSTRKVNRKNRRNTRRNRKN